jgi:serine protease
MGSANTLTLGSEVTGTLSSGDVDYYRVAVPGGRSITVRLVPPSTADHDLILRSANGSVLGRSTRGTGATDSVTWRNRNRAAQTVFVQAYHYSGAAGRYSLSAY